MIKGLYQKHVFIIYTTDIRPRNWQTVLWVIGIGKSSTALIFYESFSTPFAETV